MTKTITIRVTEEHIEKGRPKLCVACPIAYAAKAVGISHAFAEETRLWIGDCFVALPLAAQRFIKAFDAGKPVKPFSFRVRRAG